VKIVFSDTPPYFLDLGAPTLGAEQFTANGVTHWRIWCRYCDELSTRLQDRQITTHGLMTAAIHHILNASPA